MKKLKNILIYPLAIVHLPWTILRTIVVLTILLDLWCDNIITGYITTIDKEIDQDAK